MPNSILKNILCLPHRFLFLSSELC